MSRLAMDVVDAGTNYSSDPKFTEAMARKVYYGPVYFRSTGEPMITISVVGARRDAGVTVAEIQLMVVWRVVQEIKVVDGGTSYWVDSSGRLITHSDTNLVRDKTELARLPQVRGALSGMSPESIREGVDIRGRPVFVAFAPVPTVNWFVFFEMLAEEAFAPFLTSIVWSAALLIFGVVLVLLLTLWLSRRRDQTVSSIPLP